MLWMQDNNIFPIVCAMFNCNLPNVIKMNFETLRKPNLYPKELYMEEKVKEGEEEKKENEKRL